MDNIKQLFRTPCKTCIIILLLILSSTVFILQSIVYYKSCSEISKINNNFTACGTIKVKDPTKELNKCTDKNGMYDIKYRYATFDNNSPFYAFFESKDIEKVKKSKYITKIDERKYLCGDIPNKLIYPDEKLETNPLEIENNPLFVTGCFENFKNNPDYYVGEFTVDKVLLNNTKNNVSEKLKIKLFKDKENPNKTLLDLLKTDLGKKCAVRLENVDEMNDEYIVIDVYNYKSESQLQENYDFMRNIVTSYYNYHSFNLFYTSDINMIIPFYKTDAYISEGRTFTDEDYKCDKKICIISDTVAKYNNLNVEDKVSIREYNSSGSIDVFGFEADVTIYEGNIDMIKNIIPKAEEYSDYKIIGIYKNMKRDEWIDYNISANSIYIPIGAYPKNIQNKIGHISTDYLLPSTFTFSIKSPEYIKTFLREMDKSPFNDKFEIEIFDNGYTEIKSSLDSMKSISQKLMVVSLVTVLLIIILIVYLYIYKQRVCYAIMITLGVVKRKAIAFFMINMLILCIISLSISGVANHCISGKYIEYTYDKAKESQQIGNDEFSAEEKEEVNYNIDCHVGVVPIIVLCIMIMAMIELITFVCIYTISQKNILELTKEMK